MHEKQVYTNFGAFQTPIDPVNLFWIDTFAIAAFSNYQSYAISGRALLPRVSYPIPYTFILQSYFCIPHVHTFILIIIPINDGIIGLIDKNPCNETAVLMLTNL